MHKLPISLLEMSNDVAALNRAKGWRTGERTFAEYIALLHSEVSEALEAYRDHRFNDATQPRVPGEIAKPEGVGAELADVFIRLLDMCELYGIDLQVEYDRKMKYGWTRPYRHGGRTL